MSKEYKRRLSGAQLRLRRHHPFFATLALFAPVEFTDAVPTAATDGQRLFFNVDFLDTLDNAQLDGVFIHELLHAALLHTHRRGSRDALLWNIACDIVVNGIAREAGLSLPVGAVEYPPWAAFRAEEVYACLLREKPPGYHEPCMLDLLPPPATHGTGEDTSFAERDRKGHAAYWRAALNQASIMSRRSGDRVIGDLASGDELEWCAAGEAQLDWRAVLWRYLARTPADFHGFDRRFVGRGLYIDDVEGRTAIVALCVDTSGSVSEAERNLFLAEIEGLLGAYPHLQCSLFFSDAALYGPYDLVGGTPAPKPRGGGGTDFTAFFEWLAAHPPAPSVAERVCVYLTDGFGTFPSEPSQEELLWVVTPGGRESRDFPFGQVVRLGHISGEHQ